MRDPGPRPELLWLPVERLTVDHSYQRTLEGRRSKKLIERLVEMFNWAAFQAIVATPGDNGTWLIVDGQHRAEAARRLGIASVPAVVVARLTKAEQAALFVEANQQRVIVTPFALYHAKLAAGDARAQRIAAFCREYDIDIPRTPDRADRLKPGRTMALKLIDEIASDPGDTAGRQALRLLVGLWPDKPGAASALLIRAVAGALREAPAAGKIRDFLKIKGPLEWASEYRGGGSTERLRFELVAAATGTVIPLAAAEDFEDETPRRARYRHQAHPRIDIDRHAFLVDGKREPCTGKEWLIFEKLAERGGRLVTNETLYDHLYAGHGDEADPKIIDVFICKLRKKCPFPIETVWGEGYILTGYRMERVVTPAHAVPGVDRARLMGAR